MPDYISELRKRTENFRPPQPMYPSRPVRDERAPGQGLAAIRGLLGMETQGPLEMDLSALGRELKEPTSGYPTRMTEELQEPDGVEREIQEALISRGAEIESDGYAGPATLGAISEMFDLELAAGDMIPGWVLSELGVRW